MTSVDFESIYATHYSATINADNFFWLLGCLCQLHSIPFDASLSAQAYPPPFTLESFHEAVSELGMNIGARKLIDTNWKNTPLPAVAFLKTPEQEQQNTPMAHENIAPSEENSTQTPKTTPEAKPFTEAAPAIIVSSNENEITIARAGAQEPENIPIHQAIEIFHTQLILVSVKPQDSAKDDPDAELDARKQKFGFSWFIPEMLKYKKIWRDVLLASLALQLVGLATPLFTQVIIDKVIVHHADSTLIVIGVALVMFMFFNSSMSWLRQYLLLHTGNRIDAVLGGKVFRHLLRLPLPYFENRTTGVTTARIRGVETIREFVSGAAVSLILDIPFLFICLAVMFTYSVELSLVATGLLGLIALISLLVAPIFREKLNNQFLLGAQNQAFLTEYVAGMPTVKSLQMEPDVEKKYSDIFSQYLAAGFSTKQVGNTYNVIANGLEQLLTLTILILGALLVMKEDGFTIGMLVAFQMFTSRMSQPLLRLVGLWQEFQQANIAVERLGDILDMPQEPYATTPSRERAAQSSLTLHDLSFRYSENHPWLFKKINLAFKTGQLTVLMGPSGCGKSTLAKLLMGFYLPVEGHINLDGKDIRYLATNELRQTYGVVPQETILFSGTLYDNLVMAHPHAGFEEVIDACKAAEIHDVIEQLPEGYQTEIGERGTGLSGGQKQRIAIARALLKQPRILIFDEAVSNLDANTSELFAATINRLKGRVTMLFITHQIPKGLLVDNVMTFDSPATSKDGDRGGQMAAA